MSESGAHKLAMYLPASDEQIAEAAEYKAAVDWALNATPNQWAARLAEAFQRRARQRASSERVPLDLARVLDGLGWSVEYAEHFVQPYCTCGDGYDGWDYCQHAHDEGLVGGGGDAT